MRYLSLNDQVFFHQLLSTSDVFDNFDNWSSPTFTSAKNDYKIFGFRKKILFKSLIFSLKTHTVYLCGITRYTTCNKFGQSLKISDWRFQFVLFPIFSWYYCIFIWLFHDVNSVTLVTISRWVRKHRSAYCYGTTAETLQHTKVYFDNDIKFNAQIIIELMMYPRIDRLREVFSRILIVNIIVVVCRHNVIMLGQSLQVTINRLQNVKRKSRKSISVRTYVRLKPFIGYFMLI